MKSTDYSNCSTLEEVYDHQYEILRSYNKDQQHARIRLDALIKYAKQSRVIKEIGVFQGSSLIAMFMQKNVTSAVGIDINLSTYYKTMEAFVNDYSERKNKSIKMIECSSLDKKTVSNCDMLHIDSKHQYDHLMSELKLHAPSVNKFIAFHDINQNNRELYRCVVEYIDNVEPDTWKIIEEYEKGKCGHLIIGRR